MRVHGTGHFTDERLAFQGYRLLWRAGVTLTPAVNFYAAPLSEWADRDKAMAAVKLALNTSPYPFPSAEGEDVNAFDKAFALHLLRKKKAG